MVLLALLASCVKDKPEAQPQPAPQPVQQARVWIACEGSLGYGNGSLSLYLPDADSLYQNVFQTVNGQALGDVFQSITPMDDQLLLCINNSDKVVAISRQDYRLTRIWQIPKPRYILPLGNGQAFVSTMFSNKLYLLDPKSQQAGPAISMPAQNPEGMLLHQGKAYVCCWDTAYSKIDVLDPQTHQLTASIPLPGAAPQEVVADQEGMLWVLSGNTPKGKRAWLSRIDPVSGQVVRALQFPAAAEPVRLVLNPARDTLYFIEVNYLNGIQHNGVYRMRISDTALPTQAWLQAQSMQYFWGLGIRPSTGDIYVADPKGFTQKGTVFVYRPDGTLVRQFATGVGPGHFLFDE
jgi:hypothetical protein